MDGPGSSAGWGSSVDGPARPAHPAVRTRRVVRDGRPLRRATTRGRIVTAAVVLLAGCGGGSTGASPQDDGLVPTAVVATYLDRAPLPPFEPDLGVARLVECDEDVRPVWRTTMTGTTVFDDVRAAWEGLAGDDPAVELTEPVTFRDGRVHVGLRHGRVRAAVTTDRFDDASVLVEVRMPCRPQRPGDPVPFRPRDIRTATEPPRSAFPPETGAEPTDGSTDDPTGTPSDRPGAGEPLLVRDDTRPASTVPVVPRDPVTGRRR